MMKTIPMRLTLLSLLIAVSGLLMYSCKGKVKDSDLQVVIEDKAKSITGLGTATASVKDGVVTLSGEATDETAKVAYESAIKTIPGVKQVINNITVAPAPVTTEPVVISPDETLKNAVNDVLKSYNSVKADVKDGVVTLTGEIKKAELTTLMPLLHALKPKKIENKLTVKK
jgi:hyperosmotically inducible periplasmic protein